MPIPWSCERYYNCGTSHLQNPCWYISAIHRCFIIVEVDKPQLLMSVCVSACVSFRLSVCVNDKSKNNGSIHLKLEHVVVFENSSDEFDIGHCPVKVKVMA